MSTSGILHPRSHGGSAGRNVDGKSGDYGGDRRADAPMGRDTAMPPGILPKNGSIVDPLGRTSAEGVMAVDGRPQSNAGRPKGYVR